MVMTEVRVSTGSYPGYQLKIIWGLVFNITYWILDFKSVKFFDILEKSKKLLDERVYFFIDHINFLHHQVIGGLKLVVG